MSKSIVSAALVAVALFASVPAHADGDVANGTKLYPIKCGICHSLDASKIGPLQRGVVGRKAGSVEGYSYSPALKASGLTWDEATIDKWLVNPSALVPGTKMAFKLADAKERADIIAYLKSVPASK
jgi:cytochrome c